MLQAGPRAYASQGVVVEEAKTMSRAFESRNRDETFRVDCAAGYVRDGSCLQYR